MPLWKLRFLRHLVETRFATRAAEVFQRQVPGSREQVSSQRSTFWTKVLGLTNQAEETVVRDVFSNINFTQHPVGKTINRLPVPVVQLQKGCLVTLSCSSQ
jgi:hypothetical protein